jgi:hypothetical protein
MEDHLRAGIAIYNAGYYHAAHDAWEAHWLEIAEGDDRDFLQGLIQFTAAVHHTTTDNWEGAQGLAESAQDYLDGLGAVYCDVALETPRIYLKALERDPQRVGAAPPPPLKYDGRVIGLNSLELSETGIAATVLAEELGYGEETIEQAVTYAKTDVAAGEETSPFVTLVFDFVRDADHRPIVAQRLGEHVQRRRQREADVENLF